MYRDFYACTVIFKRSLYTQVGYMSYNDKQKIPHCHAMYISMIFNVPMKSSTKYENNNVNVRSKGGLCILFISIASDFYVKIQ
jgi:hypothetical protein